MTMTKHLFPKLYIIMMVGIFAILPYANAGQRISSQDAVAFIQALSDQAEPILKSGTVKDKERRILFADFIENHFSFPKIAAFTLGREWRNIDEGQQENYVDIFKTYTILINSARINDFNAATIEVLGSQESGKFDQLVKTLWIEQGMDNPVPVLWRVRLVDGTPKILDVAIAGLSMAQTQRDEFQSVLSNSGFDGLTIQLANKISQLQQNH
ncbi:MAG: phospholipid-binding protein MlaC [Alphaproteobacteria bacterium]